MTYVRDLTTPLGSRDPEVTRRLRAHVLADTTNIGAFGFELNRTIGPSR
jgi:hypothetical protein